MNQFTRFLLAALASGATVSAQTSTLCNPTIKDCPSDLALGKSIEYDLTKGAPDDFTTSTGAAPSFDKDGAHFSISKKGEAPTIFSKWYMMFGKYDIKVKVGSGQGVISSLVLLSDDLDEIDWEWLGGKSEEVQTNYFGQGKTTDYTRGKTLPNAGSQADFHTYSLEWTAEHITWAIDGKIIRTLTPDTAVKGQYPQTPMKLSIGNWVAGDVGQPQGTVDWAGGLVDWSKAPFTMTVQSIKVQDYSSGKSYSYGDKTGTWESIKSDGGKISSKGDPNAPVSTAEASGTAISQTASPDQTKAPAINPVSGGSNSTSNGTATSSSSGQKTTLASAPFPTGSNSTTATNTTSGSSSSSNGAAGSSGSGRPQTGSASRVGAGVGAMALAAAVMVL